MGHMMGSPTTGKAVFSRRMLWVALVAALLIVFAARLNGAQANEIAIVVNETVITTFDIERRRNLLRLQRTKGNLREQAREQLIEEAIKMKEVRRLRATVSDAQVDRSFNRFASANKLSSKQMAQVLSQAGVGADHFKQFIRVQMSWPRVVQARFGSRDGMSTQDLVAKMLERGGEKPSTTEYILQQVVFVIPSSKRNAILSQRRREAESMRGRFVDCRSTREFAKGLRDVSVIDLGRIMQPALPPDWKELVEKTPAGKTTGVRVTDRGVEFLAVCSSKQVSDDLAAELVMRLEEARNPDNNSENSDRYLAELREDARISYR